MLQIKNLNIIHKKDLRYIFENFSCVLNEGDKAVMIGEEGNGKSTLLQWIYNPQMISDYCEAEGERVIQGQKLGYLPQELPPEDCGKTIYEYFMEEDQFFEQTPKELNRIAAMFGFTGEVFYSGQCMGTLSGGEKVKVQMMRLILSEPDVLLLDEPSNDIDLETLEWLEKFILSWRHIILYISHDETLIERTANMVIHIEQIRKKTKCRHTIAHMSYQQYLQERFSQYENQQRRAENDRREKKLREEKYRRIFQSVEHAQGSISRQNPSKGRLLKKKMHVVKSMERRFAREDENMTEMPEEEEAIFFKIGSEKSKIPAGKTVIEYSLEKLYTPDHVWVIDKIIILRILGY